VRSGRDDKAEWGCGPQRRSPFLKKKLSMANVNAAIDYVLGWEDAGLTGCITTAPDGKRTRFGIDEHWHPDLMNCLYYSSMGSVAALQIARGIYDGHYCQPLCIAEIVHQEIANKLLSLGVNVGVKNASLMLQIALMVEGDGRIGPLTLHALDLADPAKVMEDLRAEATHYYEQVVARYPNQQMYLQGWLRRASA
jgi:lysozyme family protein